MKKVLAILGILLLALAGYIWFTYFKGGKKRSKGPEPVPLTVSKHSDTFNRSLQSALYAYYHLSESMVNWDKATTKESATALKAALDSLKIEELQKDSTGIYETALDPLTIAKENIALMLSNEEWPARRTAFNAVSENLRLLFIIVKYDQEKLYWMECPMAFGEEASGFWISRTDTVRNPYLGLHHPVYKAEMLDCGSSREEIDFRIKDTLPANKPS